MVQYRFEVAPLFHVPPAAFRPPPKVDSTVVRLVPLGSRPLVAIYESMFGEVVKRAFGQRRKTLRNALKGLVTEDQLRGVGVDPGARGETLPVRAFVAIANAAAPIRPSSSR
jgi:16S rRNA (adenine1518-N6/adenine1519-N6)-dimethyltransferase